MKHQEAGKYSHQSDEELMLALKQKESAAFEVLYDRYSERMLNYFHKMLWKDEELAQDFMHDLFAKLIEKPHLFDASRNFKTWLFSIANNMCKNEYRKKAVRGDVKVSVNQEFKGESGNESAVNMDHSQFKKELDQALNELDEVKKATFLMRYHDDLSIKEISQALKCSEGTVKSRLFYTLRELNQRLKVYEGLIGLLLLLSLYFLNA